MRRLENKVSIITGAARGQGKVEATLFAKQGAKVIITDINEKRLIETETEMKNMRLDVSSFVHDISSESSWRKLMEHARTNYNRLDVLVNNAGLLNRESLSQINLDTFKSVQDVNVSGTFLGMKYAAELMRISGGGSIVNISSVYGLVGSPAHIAYHASKGAIKIMTKSAALELAKHNIRVNTICPGAVNTSMSSGENGNHPLIDKIPLRRIAEPIEIAHAALYLASDESGYVTGTELVVDGGYTAQ